MLAVHRLIRSFEDIVDLHVEPDDVRKWIIENGFCDEVVFHYVDTDPNLFNGIFIERHTVTTRSTGVYKEPEIWREIFICDRQEEDMRRFTEVKEMLHILDREEERTADMAGVNSLANYAATHLALPNEEGAISDALAEFRALAILFPWCARDALKPAFAAGKLSVTEIADIAKVPPQYIALAMSDRWDAAYAGIAGPDGED